MHEYLELLYDEVIQGDRFWQKNHGYKKRPESLWLENYINKYLHGGFASAVVYKEPLDRNKNDGFASVYGFHEDAGETLVKDYYQCDPRGNKFQDNHLRFPSTNEVVIYNGSEKYTKNTRFSKWLHDSELDYNLGGFYGLQTMSDNSPFPSGMSIYPKKGVVLTEKKEMAWRLSIPYIYHAVQLNKLLMQSISYSNNLDGCLQNNVKAVAFFNHKKKCLAKNDVFEKLMAVPNSCFTLKNNFFKFKNEKLTKKLDLLIQSIIDHDFSNVTNNRLLFFIGSQLYLAAAIYLPPMVTCSNSETPSGALILNPIYTEQYIGPVMIQQLFSTHLEKITKSESKVISYIMRGISSEEIAKKLDLKLNTVEVYLHKIYQKLGLQNRQQLILLISNLCLR